MNEALVNRILHGDCLEWMQEIESASIDMILCDLPYGTTRNKWDIIIPFDSLWEQYERVIKNNGVIALTGQGMFSAMLMTSKPKMYRYDLIWEKDKPTGNLNAKKMPLRAHEQILIFYKNTPVYNPQVTVGHKKQNPSYTQTSGDNYGSFGGMVFDSRKTWRYPRSVLKINTVNNNGREKVKHSTQKPVALFEYLIKTYTNDGDTVLDNCSGSGTTAVAAINTGRQFICIEKEWEYCEIANERIKETKMLNGLFQ